MLVLDGRAASLPPAAHGHAAPIVANPIGGMEGRCVGCPQIACVQDAALAVRFLKTLIQIRVVQEPGSSKREGGSLARLAAAARTRGFLRRLPGDVLRRLLARNREQHLALALDALFAT